MSKLSLEWVESKTSKAGKPYKTLSVTKEDGSKLQDVAVFSFFPNFANLKPGDAVEGELVAKDYNGRTSYTLEAPKLSYSTPYRANATNRSDDIKKAQERKSESIAYFNSVNSAIALVSHNPASANNDPEQVQAFIVKWRDWFLSEYEKWNKDNTPF